METNTETVPTPPASVRKHHPCSPSTLQTREGSPCYIPRGGTSEAAERGTLQHDAADSESLPEELDDAEAAAVIAVLEMVEKYRNAPEHGPDVELIKEGKWPIDDTVIYDLDGDPWTGTTAGFADVVLVSPSTGFADVLDWKFGKHAVEPARNNTQGIAYALGVVHVYRKRGIRIKRVRVTFYSPHIEDQSSYTFEEADFPALYLRIKTIVKRAQTTAAKIAADPGNVKLYTPSVPGCMFCGRIGECEALARFALSASEKYKPLQIDTEDINYFNLTDPVKAQRALGASDTLIEWGKAVRVRLTQYALTHPEWTPEGYSLVITHPRKIVNAAEVERIAREEFGVPEEVIAAAKKLPFAPLEKDIKARAGRGQKDAAVEAFGTRLDEAGATRVSPTPNISLRIKSRRNVDKDAE